MEAVPYHNNYQLKNLTDCDPLTFWAPDENKACIITLDLGAERQFSLLQLQENYRNGQRVEEFTLEALIGQDWQEIARGSTIGYKR
ncbi:MAG: discoidin domain-containing protein, partial [Nostocales cyanobacterium W4_Combined_metabat2_030]|nr:discoidin domain-containing protein [Nostocales cyanobacterium W4_Combined_metabat2_030]